MQFLPGPDGNLLLILQFFHTRHISRICRLNKEVSSTSSIGLFEPLTNEKYNEKIEPGM